MKTAILFTLAITLALGCDSPAQQQNHVVPVVRKYFPNTLVNKKYQTGQLIGLTTDKSDYWLNDAEKAGKWAGNTIKFIDTVHFVSAYEAWCGNDCFTTVFGRYYFVDSLKVRFYTDIISRSGDCKAPTVYTKSRPALDLYLVKSSDGRLQLSHQPTANSHEK